MNTCFVVALPVESKPLQHFYGLKKVDANSHRMPVFEKEAVQCMISGVGCVRSAAATSIALAKLSKDELKHTIAVNVGLAGCSDKEILLGTPFIINRVVEHASEREFFPDLMLKHVWQEATCISYAKPQRLMASRHKLHNEHAIVDMEAAGFFQAAANFLPPQRILIVKIVSDYLEGFKLDPRFCQNLIEQQIPELAKQVEDYHQELHKNTPIHFEPEDYPPFQQICSTWKLTQSQQLMLKKALSIVHWNHPKELDERIAPFLLKTPPQNKVQGKQFLEELLRIS